MLLSCRSPSLKILVTRQHGRRTSTHFRNFRFELGAKLKSGTDLDFRRLLSRADNPPLPPRERNEKTNDRCRHCDDSRHNRFGIARLEALRRQQFIFKPLVFAAASNLVAMTFLAVPIVLSLLASCSDAFTHSICSAKLCVGGSVIQHLDRPNPVDNLHHCCHLRCIVRCQKKGGGRAGALGVQLWIARPANPAPSRHCRARYSPGNLRNHRGANPNS